MGAAWKPGQLGGSDRRGVGISCRGGAVGGAGQRASPESTNILTLLVLGKEDVLHGGCRDQPWLWEWVRVSSFWKG